MNEVQQYWLYQAALFQIHYVKQQNLMKINDDTFQDKLFS
jgi:hypothetical protein